MAQGASESESRMRYTRRIQNMGRVDRWLWGIAGAALMIAGSRRKSGLVRIAMSLLGGTMVRSAATGRSWAYRRLGINSAGLGQGSGINLESSVTVNKPVEEVYSFWHQFERFPEFMAHVADVHSLPGGITRWEAVGPARLPASWDAEIIDDRPNELISWRSLPGSLVDQAGSVHFTDVGDKGTEVHVMMRYMPPVGAAGMGVARLLRGLTEEDLTADLQRFKRIMETGTGQVATSPQPHGSKHWTETLSSEPVVTR